MAGLADRDLAYEIVIVHPPKTGVHCETAYLVEMLFRLMLENEARDSCRDQRWIA